MKDLNASVSGVANRPQADVYAFLADFANYPAWYPTGVKEASLISDDKGHAILALNQGPIQRDFEMDMAIERQPDTSVTLRREPKRPWRQGAAVGHLAARPRCR